MEKTIKQITILILERIDIKTKTKKKDKEVLYTMMMG